MAKAFEDNGNTNKWIKQQLSYSQKKSGMNIKYLCPIREEQKNSRQKNFRDSLTDKDTKIRLAIQSTIRKMKAKGKTKLEVLIALTQNHEYKAYSQYFKIWIENEYKENPRKSPWTSKTKTTPEKEER